MKLKKHANSGFTLAETTVASAILAIILVSIVTGGVYLQKIFAGSDASLTATADQSRIIDYIARDLRQAMYYQVCNSGQMLTLMVPDYVDSANPNNLRIPTVVPGTPSVANYNNNSCGVKVSYFPANAPTPPSTTYTYQANGQYLIRQAGNTQTVISLDCTNLQIGFTDQTTSVLVSINFAPRFNFSNSATERSGTTLYATTTFRTNPRAAPSGTPCLTCP